MNLTRPLSSVVDVSAGQPAPKASEFAEEGVPFVRAGSLERLLNGGRLADCEKVPEEAARRNRFRLYPKDTVVFAKSGMSATLGRVYRLEAPAYVVSHLAALVPTGSYDPVYLTYWLRRNPPCHLIKDRAYPSIRVSEIEGVQVPDILPSEQQRIGAMLDKADGIRRKRALTREMASELLTSSFRQLFGDLFANDRKWDSVSLGDLMTDDPQNGLYRPAKDYGQGTRILRIDGFYDGYLLPDRDLKRLRVDSRTVEKYRLKEGDIVVNRVNSRPFLGKSALVENLAEDTVFESNMMRFALDTDRICPRFLIDQLQTHYIKLQILKCAKDAVNQSSINQTDVKSLIVRLPPISLQRRYRAIVMSQRKLREQLDKAVESASQLFDSLSQSALNGVL